MMDNYKIRQFEDSVIDMLHRLRTGISSEV